MRPFAGSAAFRRQRLTVPWILLSLVLTLASSRAEAQEETTEGRDLDDYELAIVSKHNAITVDLGLGAATGFFGVAYSYSPIENLQVEAGTGIGVSGIQLSLMPKLVVGSVRDHYVLGVGVAVAFPMSRLADGHPVWLNVDALGYEHRFDHGMSFTLALGATGGLGGGRVCSLSLDCEQLPTVRGVWYPQARIGIGSWF